ncbi:MAG: TolC family protein [Phycisphaerae bacterium]|nr:TolC family protein [Phycisphaerae bacterium]
MKHEVQGKQRCWNANCLITGLVVIVAVIAVNTVFAEEQNVDMEQEYQGKLLLISDIINDKSSILDSQGRTVMEISLSELIARALKHNLDIQVSRFEPSIKMADVTSAEAAFDAVLFGSSQWGRDDRANIDATFYDRTITSNGRSKVIRIPVDPFVRTHSDQYSIGINKKLPTGATVEVAQTLRRYRDMYEDDTRYYDPFWEYGLEMQLNQPLLRDFGIEVNRARIEIYKNDYRASKQEFQQTVIEIAASVETNYWRLFQARQQVKILQQLIDRSEQSLQRAHQRDDYDGRSLSVSRIKGVLEQGKADMVSAINNVQKQQEILLASLNDPELPISGKWELITLDNPSNREFNPDAAGATEIALRVRPELINQRLRLKSSEIVKDVAKNQRLPRLDMVLKQRITGAGVEGSDAWDSQWDGQTTSYTFGVNIELPIANRAAQADYLKSQRQLQQARLSLKNIQEQIIADVNIAAHNVQYTYDELAGRANKAQTDKEELLSYMISQDNDARTSLTPDFIDRKVSADQRMTNSQFYLVQTMINYDLAIMNYYRAQGTLLRYNNIKVGEEAIKD